MSIASRSSIVALTIALAACGKPLGTYQVRDVRLVPGEAVKKIERYIDADPQMLRIEFTSNTDLSEASDGGGSGLYVFASFCPYDEKRKIYVAEPYYNDRSRYGPTHVLERKVLPDDKVIEKVAGEDRRPVKDVTGKYVYTTYLRLRGDASVNRGDGRPDFAGYDLRQQHVDLCLRINHPDYVITPSHSRVFVVPAVMIQRALLNKPSVGRALLITKRTGGQILVD